MELSPNANSHRSAWFVSYPLNMHSDYEAQIRRGWAFAHAFVQRWVMGGRDLLTDSLKAVELIDAKS